LCEEEETPELLYRRAKEQIAFDNNYAFTIFTQIFQDENAIAMIAPSSPIRWYFGLERSHDAIADSIISPEQAQNDCFSCVSDRINRSNSVNLFLDLKLRQAELYLRFADSGAPELYLKPAVLSDASRSKQAIRLSVRNTDFDSPDCSRGSRWACT
jgi:hypothetical protein